MRTIAIVAAAVAAAVVCKPTGLRAQQVEKRPKVAVVLSGGGAKGMAHIGALKVIEQAGIPIDIVTGTSMGSIIGGLYAIGYNARELDSLVRQQDWNFVLSDKSDMSRQSLANRQKENTYLLSRDIVFVKNKPVTGGGFIVGKNLAKLFSGLTVGYRDSMDFNRLPIPFACVATNIVDNTEYVFHSGVLAEAMRASMAIPGAFAPVRKADMVLVDGGLRNNFPVDVARAMGADYVIGVTVQGPPKTADDLNSGGSILGQIVDVNCKNKYDENIADADIVIRANTEGYTAASFTHTAIDTLIVRGQAEALKHWDALLTLKRKLGLPAHYVQPRIVRAADGAVPACLRLNRVIFEGVEPTDSSYLERQYRFAERDSIRTYDMDRVVNTMRVDLYYDNADVWYRPVGEGYDVVVTANNKKATKLNLGARFDTEEMVAMQVNAGFFVKSGHMPMTADFTLHLGKRIAFKGDFSVHPYAWGRMSFSYLFRHDDINVYDRGERAYNMTYNEHKATLNLFDFNVRNFNFTIGAAFDYFDYRSLLLGRNPGEGYEQPDCEHFWNYRADVTYNSENNWYFASTGANFHAGFVYYTDNLATFKGHSGFSALSTMWRWAFPLNSRLTFQPMLYGRLLFGTDLPYVARNVIGGDWFGHYFEQQMPFAGVGYMETTDNHFVALQLKLQQRIVDNNYILLKVVGAQHADKFKHLLRHGPMLGYQAAYYYQSMLGPLGASVGYSNKTGDVYFCINLGFVF